MNAKQKIRQTLRRVLGRSSPHPLNLEYNIPLCRTFIEHKKVVDDVKHNSAANKYQLDIHKEALDKAIPFSLQWLQKHKLKSHRNIKG